MNPMSENPQQDPWDQPPADAQAWLDAANFVDMCALAAAYLEGELDCFPGWMSESTDDETDEILPELLSLTQRGVLPLASQLGEARALGHDDRAWSRRAFLSGFATPKADAACSRRVRELGMVWCSFPAGEWGRSREIVGLRGGEAFLWAGRAAGAVELEIFEGAVSASALAELHTMRYFSCFDPIWGRSRALFDALSGGSALRHTTS
ncbi:MAG: hypothetical protein ACI841_002830 [Planctomycetota bacterium]|jgi:hypothetical protein